MVKRNACVFISGEGSNLRNLLKRSRDYNFPVSIKLVISNNPKAKGVNFTKKYSIPYFIVNTKVRNFENIILAYLKRYKINIICLAGATDPRNIGSIIRSASAFNIDGIIVRERDYPETSKLMHKAASGSIEHLNIFVVSNINSTLKFLRDKNFWVYGLDISGDKDLTDVKWDGNNVLVFGSEGYGMKKHTEKYLDFIIKIEINNKVESLNLSNSAAIVFHQINTSKK